MSGRGRSRLVLRLSAVLYRLSDWFGAASVCPYNKLMLNFGDIFSGGLGGAGCGPLRTPAADVTSGWSRSRLGRCVWRCFANVSGADISGLPRGAAPVPDGAGSISPACPGTARFPGRHASGGMNCLLRAFTLIELMLVVAILGILVALANTGYQNYVQKSKRAEGRAFLLEVAGKMEQYHYAQRKYPSDLGKLGYGEANPLSGEEFYSMTLECQAGDGNVCQTYTLRAEPQSPDPKCGTLTYDSEGEKGQDTGGSRKECWGVGSG